MKIKIEVGEKEILLKEKAKLEEALKYVDGLQEKPAETMECTTENIIKALDYVKFLETAWCRTMAYITDDNGNILARLH